jgi:hypothetical protein
MMPDTYTNTVRAALVEALFFPCGREERQGFDKLSPNGMAVL